MPVNTSTEIKHNNCSLSNNVVKECDSYSNTQHELPLQSLEKIEKKTHNRSGKPMRLLLVILTVLACFGIENFVMGRHSVYFVSPRKLKCLYVMKRSQTSEGIGSIIQRNQLAAFISSVYNIPLEFPQIPSRHGYNLNDLFSRCTGGANVRKIPRQCQIKYKSMKFGSCPRGDCHCKTKQLKKHLHGPQRDCELLGVWYDDIYNLEFSGCLGGMVRKYFGNDTKPKQQYNVIHYRKGDLRKAKPGDNAKVFSPLEIAYIIEAFCYLNELPIVVITQGSQKLPICGNRVILASDLSLRENFKIVQHSTNIAVGESSFAVFLMEAARPQKVVMLQRNARFYDWVACEDWTILGERGAMFHFTSKKLMIETVITRESVRHLGIGTNRRRRAEDTPIEIPKLRWPEVDLFENPIVVKSSSSRSSS